MSIIPNTQKAWVCTGRGLPRQAMKFITDHPVSTKLESGDLLVKVQAAALNPGSSRMMQLAPSFVMPRPYIVEWDFSGVIVDQNSTDYVVGDEVYGMVLIDVQKRTRQGSLAEYIRVPAIAVAKRPSNISPILASGITIASLSAYIPVVEYSKIGPGDMVFINGGSSAVGIFAIQIAKAKGATVWATASGKNEALVRSLGAEEFIDYTKGPLHKQIMKNPPASKFKLVYDAVGLADPSLYIHSKDYLDERGIFVSSGPFHGSTLNIARTFANALLPGILGGVNRQWKFLSGDNNPGYLEDIRQMVEAGTIKPVLDSTFELEDVLDAYDRVLTSRAVGKVVIKIDCEES